MEEPQEVAWIYFDPSMNDFSHSTHMPVAMQKRIEADQKPAW